MRNILVPMSGRGSRFKEVGYKLPKPLIDVNGKPMIQRVVENLNLDGKYIFLALKEHCEEFGLKELLPTFCEKPYNDLTLPNIGGHFVNKYGEKEFYESEVVVVDQVTEGAACTALLAKKLINNDDELFIANSDQLVDWNSNDFIKDMRSKNADGGILTFKDTNPKWSFAKVANGIVTEVAEKKPISDNATVGVYYYKYGKDFISGAEQMIKKNIRTNNEYYIAPAFNELIEQGKKIYTYEVKKMHGLGTPLDLESYLNK